MYDKGFWNSETLSEARGLSSQQQVFFAHLPATVACLDLLNL
jgi:hypothetical protein